MKRFAIIVVALAISAVCNAQYHHHYPYPGPYEYASAMAEIDEDYRLSQIRFDEYALRQNPQAWSAYLNYVQINDLLAHRAKAYKIVSWAGLGLACASFIPLAISVSPSGSDTGQIIGLAMVSAGTAAAFTGLIGIMVNNSRMKENKKDFIFYLRTTNNGVGIVTLF